MKETTEDKNWALIAKHLGKEMDDKENEQLAKWLEESDVNRKELENAEKIWQLSSTKESQLFDTNQGWGKMWKRIHYDTQGIQHAIRKHILVTITKVAASLLILMTLAFAVHWLLGKSNYMKVTAENEKILEPIKLPDGSRVYLNAGSTIKYPKAFKNEFRTVELTGEAFFEVTHNREQPFIIQTPKAQIKVLGTSFDVTAYYESDSVQVVVETGTVELSSKKAKGIIQLTRGNTGVYYANSNKLVKSAVSDVNAFAWKTNDIIFNKSNLDYVSKTLIKVFSQPVILDNANLKNCRLDANFKGRDLESILEVIKETLNLKVKKTGNGYILTGKGC